MSGDKATRKSVEAAGHRKSQVLSIRIDPELLEAVRERAESEGRSVSGEIVFIVREQLAGYAVSRDRPRPISGWLAPRDVLSSHAEFRRARAEASATLTGAVRAKARKRIRGTRSSGA